MGILWPTTLPVTTTLLRCVLPHFPTKRFSLKTQLWLLPIQTPLPGLKQPFPTVPSSFHSFLLQPPTRTRLTGPGEFVNALPVPGSVLVPVQVLFLLPILNLNHLFQEDLPERLWPTLIYPLLCVSLELNTLPAFTLVRTICYVHSFDKRLLRVYTMC